MNTLEKELEVITNISMGLERKINFFFNHSWLETYNNNTKIEYKVSFYNDDYRYSNNEKEKILDRFSKLFLEECKDFKIISLETEEESEYMIVTLEKI